MGKLVILKLDGDLAMAGFKVVLEIAEEGNFSDIKIIGYLPPSLELSDALDRHWLEYRRLGMVPRIKSKKIKYSGSVNDPVQTVNDSGKQIEQCFTRWLKSETFREVDVRLREELNRDETVRILLQTEDRHLSKLPWHRWDFMNRYPKAELALSPVTYKKPKLMPQPIRKARVRILAILGSSQGIDIQKDRVLLEQLPHAEVVFLAEPKHRQINDRLWEQPWDIIFFAGHGEEDRIYINETDSLTLNELWYSLRKAVERGLKLAIFNSCQGLGLVKRLDDLEIPQIIVMREMVPDEIAQKFLQDFLKSFSEGQELYMAFREAREKLQGWEREFPCASWLPIVCQNPSALPPTWNSLLGDENSIQRSFFPLQSIEQLYPFNRVKTRFYDRLGLTTIFLLVTSVVGWQLAGQKLAVFFNDLGLEKYQSKQLLEAKKLWDFAAAINPDNRAILYNKGWHCEDIKNFTCAYQYYQKAAQLGMPAAFSNLARLSIILYKDYQAAVDFSQKGLELAEDRQTQYSLNKNLGWARLEQGRYPEALEHLNQAIRLDDRRASAYCLKAQAIEAEGNERAALLDWQMCLKYADTKKPDEDIWIGKARHRLGSHKSP